MLYLHHGDRPSRVEPLAGLPDRGAIASAVWIDLDQPGGDEVALVEAALGIELPTAEDLYEIEASSRAYRDNGASYMTAVVVAGMDSGTPVSAPIGFVLAPAGQLVTLRLTSPKAFQTARQLATRAPVGPSGRAVMLRLLDLIVDRAADVLEMLGARIDETSAAIFGRADPPDRRLSPRALQNLLHAIGNNQYALNKVHESLQTLSRVVSFLTATMAENGKPDRGDRDALRSLVKDNPHGPDGFIFWCSKKDEPWDQQMSLYALQDMLVVLSVGTGATDDEKREARAYWKERNIVFHSWRHFYASRMADRLEARKVMLVTGHKTRAVFDGYADHALDSDLSEVAQASEETFKGIIPVSLAEAG